MLLIAAVEFQQLNGIFTEANLVIAQLREQWLPQMLAVELALLRFGEFDCSLSATGTELPLTRNWS